MVSYSRFSDPNRKPTDLEEMAAAPANMLEAQFNNMTGDRMAKGDENNNLLTNVGHGIENMAVGGVNLANNTLQSGAENMRSEGWPQKLLGAAQLILGNIGKMLSSLFGMTPTGVGKMGELASGVWNGVTGKKPETEIASASKETAPAPSQPLRQTEQPYPGNIPNASPLQERGGPGA